MSGYPSLLYFRKYNIIATLVSTMTAYAKSNFGIFQVRYGKMSWQ
jgi:hypothetical protein